MKYFKNYYLQITSLTIRRIPNYLPILRFKNFFLAVFLLKH